jgi:hypothetical protein
MGVDAVVEHHLTVLGGSPCRVKDDHSTRVAPRTPTPLSTDMCKGLAMQGGTVVLQQCGSEGDLPLPSLS